MIIAGLFGETVRGSGSGPSPIENQISAPIEPGLHLDHPQGPEGIWNGEIGDGFIKNVREADVSFTLALGLGSLIDCNNHDLALGTFHYGWMFGDVVGKDHWYRGNWELLGEAFAGAQYHPNAAYVAGVTPMIRYNFATGTRLMPFINGGAGSSVTDIGNPDLSTIYEFNLQAGLGFHYFWRKNAALTFESRYLHFSNASIKLPNQGVNTVSFLVGFSWFF